MQIQRDEHGRRGAFFIERDGEWVAEMSYTKARPDVIVIDHTEVDKSLRGQGIAQQMVREAVNFARANNLKIRARCPYVRNVLDETAEYNDIII
jgi:predicted GNAT family acetyltransferase